jgi:hypothetical protein
MCFSGGLTKWEKRYQFMYRCHNDLHKITAIYGYSPQNKYAYLAHYIFTLIRILSVPEHGVRNGDLVDSTVIGQIDFTVVLY